MNLSVGHIAYANCIPFFHHLSEAGFRGPIVRGVPSELNRLLSQGEIDLSPSSSFEYGREWRNYLLLPGLSISAAGPVKSVLLLSRKPLESLTTEEIALTGESATSVHLLQILLREYCGFDQVQCRVPQEPIEEILAAGGAALLIGDRALKASLAATPGTYIYDLGELWHRHTGLPFVFALWILRKDSARQKHEAVVSFLRQLNLSCEMAFASLENLAAHAPERSWMGEAGLVSYWKAMSYILDEVHIEGLKLFFRLSVKYGFLPEMPEIRFFK